MGFFLKKLFTKMSDFKFYLYECLFFTKSVSDCYSSFPVCIAIGVTPVSLVYNSLSNIPVSGILFLSVKY